VDPAEELAKLKKKKEKEDRIKKMKEAMALRVLNNIAK